jgi:hypothetical protein
MKRKLHESQELTALPTSYVKIIPNWNVYITYVLSSLELGQPELDFWAFFIEAKTLRKHAILRKIFMGKVDRANENCY